MRKIISSAFILLLLLVSLFGVGAWLLGVITEQNFNVLLEDKNKNTNRIFDFQLLAYERSIFKSKAKISVSLNLQNQLTQFIEDSGVIEQSPLQLDFDINHGPVLFDKSGIHLGKAEWKLISQNLSKQKDTIESLRILGLNKLKNTYVRVGFDDVIDYQIPFTSNLRVLIITGSYDPKSEIHNGKISSDQLVYEGGVQKLVVKPFNLNYQLLAAVNSKNTEIKLSVNVSKLEYQHNSLNNKLNVNVNYDGDISINNSVLNSDNRFLFNFDGSNRSNDSSSYPIEKGELTFDIKEINLIDLKQLNTSLSQHNNLHQQSQWILEEQGELPEGQDQIWQAQDNASQYAKILPKLIRKALLKNKSTGLDNSKVNFTFHSEYRNKQSKLNGSIFPATDNLKENLTSISVFSLIETQVQVNLGEGWYQYLSSRLPIRERDFKLIYKQNKLLMQ